LLASSSIGNHNALFEPIHGTFHQATGKDIANPLASILSASMLLWHLGLHEEADAIERAVEKSIALGITTRDMRDRVDFTTSRVFLLYNFTFITLFLKFYNTIF
jgi:3-isopropylmalate dehydrogenase